MKDKLLIICSLIIITLSCGRSRFDADISDIDLNIEIKRFEVDIFNLDFDSIEKNIPYLESKYGEFFDIFNHHVVNLGSHENIAYPSYLKSFLTDFSIYEIQMETFNKYESIDGLEKQLNTAFKYYKYYFPEMPVPEIVTFISGFNQSVVTSENLIGIALDKYLGAESELYTFAQFPNYLRRNMHQGKILSDVMRAWATTEFEFNAQEDNLLNNMIYEGMVLYFVYAMLPDEPDTLKLGFTSNQFKFCEMNEKNMWTYLVEQKLLFNSEYRVLNQFLNEGPFTKDFTNESPARAAAWLGLQIVKSYMNRNKHVSLNELMHETDYQKILTESRYDP